MIFTEIYSLLLLIFYWWLRLFGCAGSEKRSGSGLGGVPAWFQYARVGENYLQMLVKALRLS
jgi:hypothetical protein